ncbi:MAG TPA: Asp-tRNA(Asn)/Glu-tRNA(Gln) amidotransferase subunit GatA [Longimicrobiales bacterium]|nr:Asp-tRNA(Asn)/Glu-tRNA(Gln) amidotransferase subunit GatA [Longimicrobiales bacterium]
MSEAAHLRPLADIARGAVSAVDVARACMTAVVNGDSGPDRLNAFISYDYEAALAQAERVDDDVAQGTRPRLAGVPIALKDNICTLGLPTTCASRMLARYRSPYEATAVRRLRAAGAVIVGKTNLDEFAMGSSTETSAFGPTHNPHDPARVPGGSSGGSAAAVAAGMVPAALGSDTGGSVRQPAAFCGVVGVRPTWGRVSRYGLVAFASSLDQIGVLGRSVADAALLLDVISGADRLDPTAAAGAYAQLVDGSGEARAMEQGRRSADKARPPVIGVPQEYFTDDVDEGVHRACERALDALRAAGCTIRDVSLPHTRHAVPAYTVLAAAEASTNLARFDGVRYGVRTDTGDPVEASRTTGLGTEVKRRIMLGTYVLSAGHHDEYFAAAQRIRALITRDFERALGGVDVLFTPTATGPAFAIGAKEDPCSMYASDAFTAPASLAGLPAMSLPIGRVDGLPVGGQFVAARWRDDAMLAAAGLLERLLAR